MCLGHSACSAAMTQLNYSPGMRPDFTALALAQPALNKAPAAAPTAAPSAASSAERDLKITQKLLKDQQEKVKRLENRTRGDDSRRYFERRRDDRRRDDRRDDRDDRRRVTFEDNDRNRDRDRDRDRDRRD